MEEIPPRRRQRCVCILDVTFVGAAVCARYRTTPVGEWYLAAVGVAIKRMKHRHSYGSDNCLPLFSA